MTPATPTMPTTINSSSTNLLQNCFQECAHDGETQQTRHIIKCHCHLSHRKMEARGLLVPSQQRQKATRGQEYYSWYHVAIKD